MKLLTFLSKLIPEGIIKDLLRCPVYWTQHKIKFIKRKVALYGNINGLFYFYPFEEQFDNYELQGYLEEYKPRKGDVVIDAGAYAGHFTVIASKLVGKNGVVIAFEPDPFNCIELKKTIKANNLTNVIVIQKGLSDKKGSFRWSIGGVESQIGNSDIFKIKTTTLDDISIELNLKQVDFIKMDIEGAEIAALKGAKETLKHTKNLAIASYHIVNGEKTCFKVEKILKNSGFKVKTKEAGQLLTYSRK